MSESKLFIANARPIVYRYQPQPSYPKIWIGHCPCNVVPWKAGSWRQAYDHLSAHVKEWHL